ncbi:MAG: hypothetical protein JOZ29_22270 [Deltaproteobacteria bacterium]|nr:hypothetical protein [Deltaproteobacteria bacterium]
MVRHYYFLVLRHATERTVAFAKAQGLFIGLVLPLLGVLTGITVEVYRHIRWSTVMSDLIGLIITVGISGVAPILVVAMIAFGYYLVRAPAELGDKKQKYIETLESERDRREITEQVRNNLAVLLTEAGNLFDQGRLTPPDKINELKTAFEAWFQKTFNIIQTQGSDAEARLFRELVGGGLIAYVWNPEQNQILNMLRGYQNNLRGLIQRVV